MTPVTDPSILQQLNGGGSGLKPVADPAILAQLNGSAEPPAPAQPQQVPQQPLQQPSMMDRLQANPVLGAPLQTLLRTGQGLEQLLLHGGASVAPGLFGDLSKRADTAISEQNKGYEDAGARVDAASTDPRLSGALRRTGEVGGNFLNPAGLAGNAIDAAPGLANAALRGATGGAAFGASQPVLGDTPDYWTEKAKQVGISGLTGAVTGAAAEALAGKPPTDVPKASTFKGLASDSYDAAKATGATVPKTDFEKAIYDAEQSARKDVTYRPTLQPKATAAIDAVRQDLAALPPEVSFQDMDVARRVMRTVLSSPDKNERAVAHSIIDGIDNYVTGLNAPEGDALSTARDLFTRGSKLDTVERLVSKAQTKAEANQTQSRVDNAIRQQFASLKNNQRAFGQFNPDEQAAISQIIAGNPLQNAARQVGKVAPTGTIPILAELGSIGGAIASGNPLAIGAAVGTPVAGLVGQHIADKAGKANVNNLKNVVAGRNSLALPRPSPNLAVGNPFAFPLLLKPRAQ